MLRSKTILIVDDSDDTRHLFSIMARSLCDNVLEANDGLSATTLIGLVKVDLIILDWRMPVMSGYEFLEWCESNNLTIPVIVCSADVIARSGPLPYSAYVTEMTKIVTMQKFADTVNAAYNKSGGGNVQS
jgi:CheY-like chemotaxis protein